MNLILSIIKDFFHLFLPDKCLYCGLSLHNFEKYVCSECLHKIPLTHFKNNQLNEVQQVFWGRLNLQYTISFYFFHKGSVLQELMHHIKYRNGKELAYELGKKFGYALKEAGIAGNIEAIVPVPLHSDKERRRGYNQSSWLAKGIGEIINSPIEDKILKRKKFTATQTKKNRVDRWENVKDAFILLDKKKLEGRHIAILDDVITTGATIEACASELLKIKGIKLSVLSLAYASD